jgi:hypothetical protein
MQSTTTSDLAVIAALSLEERVTIAADLIGAELNVPQSIALRTLAAIYQRATFHVVGPADRRHEAVQDLIQSAMCARRLAVAIEAASRTT